MLSQEQLVDRIIRAAIRDISEDGGKIITFSLYFDHEGKALSACADTAENSEKSIKSMNAFSYRYLKEAIDKADLKSAANWRGSSGNSLSVGDFKYKNLARTQLLPEQYSKNVFVEMAKGLLRNTDAILKVCDPDKQILFSSSTENDEVGLYWSPP